MADNQTIKLSQGKDFITLGQMLQNAGIIDTGGQAKWFLTETTVEVNGDIEQRRGRKLYKGDQVGIADHGIYTVIK